MSSPTIRVNGRDIAPEPRESECGADGCGCGPGASCRVWRYRGRDYAAAPVGLIVDAVLAELYGGSDATDPPAAPYELPDNLERVFAAKRRSAAAGAAADAPSPIPSSPGASCALRSPGSSRGGSPTRRTPRTCCRR